MGPPTLAQIELFFDLTNDAGQKVPQPFTISWTKMTPSTKRVIVGASAGTLYRTTYYSRFKAFNLDAEATVCLPEEEAGAGGDSGALSESRYGGVRGPGSPDMSSESRYGGVHGPGSPDMSRYGGMRGQHSSVDTSDITLPMSTGSYMSCQLEM
eukprot:859145-Pyramimonas_sp.AAC.2